MTISITSHELSHRVVISHWCQSCHGDAQSQKEEGQVQTPRLKKMYIRFTQLEPFDGLLKCLYLN